VEHVPYRTADERPPGPEDEEATPPEWRAPVPYRFSALAFPSRGQYVLALLSLKRSSLTWPGILLAGGTFMLVLGSAVSCNQSSMVTPLTLVGAVMAALGLGLLALAFSPALFALRERFVRERSAGPSGLYIRTHSFERREKWPAISALVVSRKRVAVCSAGLIHVIPLSAFATDQDRKSFTRAIETEIAKFLPSASR
jgi:hypothetical protein